MHPGLRSGKGVGGGQDKFEGRRSGWHGQPAESAASPLLVLFTAGAFTPMHSLVGIMSCSGLSPKMQGR